MPDLNLRNPEVTQELYGISDYWLTAMNVDGFRVDAAKHLIEDGRAQQNSPETLDWLVRFQDHIRSVRPGAFTVGEVSGGNASTLAPYYPDRVGRVFPVRPGRQHAQGVQFRQRPVAQHRGALGHGQDPGLTVRYVPTQPRPAAGGNPTQR